MTDTAASATAAAKRVGFKQSSSSKKTQQQQQQATQKARAAAPVPSKPSPKLSGSRIFIENKSNTKRKTRANPFGMTHACIERMVRQGGVFQPSPLSMPGSMLVNLHFMVSLVRRAIILATHSKRKTLSVPDLQNSASMEGLHLAGYVDPALPVVGVSPAVPASIQRMNNKEKQRMSEAGEDETSVGGVGATTEDEDDDDE